MSRSKEKVVSSLRKIFKSNTTKDETPEEKNPAEEGTAKKPAVFPESPGKRIRRLDKK